MFFNCFALRAWRAGEQRHEFRRWCNANGQMLQVSTRHNANGTTSHIGRGGEGQDFAGRAGEGGA